MLVGEGGSGMASRILILLNFMIAKRRNFSATSQANDVLHRQHVMVIGRNKRHVERTVVVVGLRRTVAHCCENIVSMIKMFNLPMRVLSFKFCNCAMRHN